MKGAGGGAPIAALASAVEGLAQRLGPDDPALEALRIGVQRLQVMTAETEAALKDQRAGLQAAQANAALLDALSGLLPRMRLGPDLQVIEANPEAAALTGVAAGGSLAATLLPQEAERLRAALQAGGAGGAAPRKVELAIGLAVVSAPEVILVPQRKAWAWTVPDLLHQVLEVCGDEIVVLDGAGRVIYANPAWSGAHGAADGAAIGRSLTDLLPLHAALREGEQAARILGGAAPTHDVKLREGSGQGRRRLAQHRFALRDAAGRAVAVAVRLRDETEMLRLTEDLKFSNIVLEQSLDAILITDAAMRVRQFNPAFVRMTGFGAVSLRGKPLEALMPSRQSEEGEAWRAMVAALREEGRWQGELSLRGASGGEVFVWCSANQLHDEDGVVFGHVLLLSDLTRLYQVQAENERLSGFDTLTHLPNRKLVSDRLEEELRLARRAQGSFAVIFLDLDAFKTVNDSLGHAAGDQLLTAIAERLAGAMGPGETVARIGGDEFLVVLPECDAGQAAARAQLLFDNLARPVDLEGMAGYRPSASMGIAMYPDHGLSVPELLRSADTAMYAAKTGHGRVAFYQSDMRREASHLLDLRNALTGAVERGEFQLFYQPICRISDGIMVGAEALLRWHRPGHGLLLPGDFLHVAEMSGLMREIDRWVLTRAVADLTGWAAAGLLPPGWRHSVNQTAEDLVTPDWVHHLQGLLGPKGQLGSAVLQIELTEGHVSGSLDALQRSLRALGPLGVRLAVDDFGTGSSNLSYLRSLPISTIKIDRGFVRGIEEDPDARILVQAMIGLGQKFGYEMLAEGIETEAQAEILRAAGCDLVQGFLMARPLDPAAFTRRLLNRPVAAR